MKRRQFLQGVGAVALVSAVPALAKPEQGVCEITGSLSAYFDDPEIWEPFKAAASEHMIQFGDYVDMQATTAPHFVQAETEMSGSFVMSHEPDANIGDILRIDQGGTTFYAEVTRIERTPDGVFTIDFREQENGQKVFSEESRRNRYRSKHPGFNHQGTQSGGFSRRIVNKSTLKEWDVPRHHYRVPRTRKRVGRNH